MNKPTSLTSVIEAQHQIMAHATCCLATQMVPLFNARGRVLSAAVISCVAVPPADNSAMDGYALRVKDLALKVIPVSQRIAAGQVAIPLEPNTCARIFTGAEVPDNAELVVLQEDVEVVDSGIRILPSALQQGQKLGQFIRPKGQDIVEGQQVCAVGTKLEARHLGVLASMGIEKVEVYRRLTVAIASTGSELVNPGQSLKVGQIYNSNRFLLAGLVDQLGMDLVDIGIITDERSTTEAKLALAAEQADIVITSGGVSEGEEDHVKAAVETLGRLEMWKLAIKPGKPLAFGKVKQTPFFGLPGNPASVLVTFMVMVRPFLLALQGCSDTQGYSLKARLVNPPNKPSIRQEYQRVRLVDNGQSELLVEAMTNQNSGVLTTAMKGDGLAVIKANTCGSEAQEVEFMPYACYGV
ncbi:MAG: molybdopterin molybdotransferase MoeA [Gammaproteobacteria bacterium]|nr:molybdopterin molybdotransferase MoeA [Gammaproteobacteria bacterium]